ncbi:3-dehydroquinate synthase [Candidatus Marinamargulisbacteria bacterium]|jgi:3-dehydroquinate synthase|nr:3-dehydroquinate synthase [Candidatus Marinamargulisbacteria bacterium]
MTKTTSIQLKQVNSRVDVGWGCLSQLGSVIRDQISGRRLVIVTQSTIPDSYCQAVTKSCKSVGFNVQTIIIPDGEKAKSMDQVSTIITQLLTWRLDRHDALIALGGGVVGDLTGFVAAIYLRGIAVIQVPTTLLAQVDAAIGGKTGVNHPLGKNLIGSFHQPLITYCDVATLCSLPKRPIQSGLAEVIKYGMIMDAQFFNKLLTQTSALSAVSGPEPWMQIVQQSAQHKVQVVNDDEKEANRRMILNFGHTIGHAIEVAGEYQHYFHGEAIALGMLAETRLAIHLGLCQESVYESLFSLIQGIGLPTQLDIPKSDLKSGLIDTMRLDKKAIRDQLRFVLPTKIGDVTIVSVVESDIQAVLDTL